MFGKLIMTENETQEKIDTLFKNFAEFLKEKNRRYGNAASEPISIFSNETAINQICNRLDDKLSRVKRSRESGEKLRKNDVCDVFGYTALLMIQNEWLEFEDLLD